MNKKLVVLFKSNNWLLKQKLSVECLLIKNQKLQSSIFVKTINVLVDIASLNQ